MSIDINIAKEMVLPFYDLLNQPGTKAVAATMQKLAADDWRSYAGETVSKGRDEFVAQVIGFGKLIPDLAWSIKEILVAGDRIVVRSEASGTPAGELFGMPHTGRSFRIMAIDIHTVRDGKLTVAYHVEDWASALRQLAGK
jgi:predicted ester cyclase